MPATIYRCTNFGGCDKALAHEDIEIDEGDDPICPNPDCGQRLELLRKTGPEIPKWVFAVAAVVLCAVGVWLWVANRPIKPNPDKADKMLSEYYPRLPAK